MNSKIRKLLFAIFIAGLSQNLVAAVYNEPDYDGTSPTYTQPYPGYSNTSILKRKTSSSNDLGWYMGLNAGVGFLNHSYNIKDVSIDDKVTMGRQFAAEFNIGRQFGNTWRLQLDGGLFTEYQDRSSFFYWPGMAFIESSYYGTLDLLYVFDSGFYFGLGGGATMVSNKFNLVDSKTNTYTAPMGAAMLGYEFKASDDFRIDLGVKFSGWMGKEINYPEISNIKISTGFTYNLAAMVGMKFLF